MALDKRLLDILCCPATRQPLQPLGGELLRRLNQRQAAGDLCYADGSAVQAPLSAGLITRDGRTVYRIDDGIPVLLVDQAIAMSQLEAATS